MVAITTCARGNDPGCNITFPRNRFQDTNVTLASKIHGPWRRFRLSDNVEGGVDLPIDESPTIGETTPQKTSNHVLLAEPLLC